MTVVTKMAAMMMAVMMKAWQMMIWKMMAWKIMAVTTFLFWFSDIIKSLLASQIILKYVLWAADLPIVKIVGTNRVNLKDFAKKYFTS